MNVNVHYDVNEAKIYPLIQAAYEHAVSKHPEFPKDHLAQMCILMEEVGEMAQAINDGNPRGNLKHEILDVCAVAVRMLLAHG